MSRQLPPQPHLDVLKKQARQLLNDCQAGQPEVVAQVQAVLADLPPSAAEVFTLRHAQQVVARDYGFTSWQALIDHVGRLSGEGSPRPSSPLPVHYDKLARDLVEALRDGHPQSFGRLGETFRDRMAAAVPTPDAESGQPEHSLEQARLAVAAESGCNSWDVLAEKVAESGKTGLMNLEQLRGFERMHAEFARLLAARIAATGDTDRPVGAEIAFVDQTSYGEYVISLSMPTCAFRVAVGGLDNDLVFSLATPVVDDLLAVGQGGRATRLEEFAEGMARDLESIWNPVTKLSVGQIELHTDPFAIGTAPMYEVSVLVAFQVKTNAAEEELSGLVEICYPGSAIRGAMDSLEVHVAGGNPQSPG